MDLGHPLKAEGLEPLVEAIFADGDVHVYEAYSAFDHELREFRTKDEVMTYIDEIRSSHDNFVYLSLHYSKTEGFVYKERIALIPEKCDGAEFRYSIAGWGLIQFLLCLKNQGLSCDIGVNSEKRAHAWEATYPELKSPSLWNWKEVEKQCRRLKRVLKKYS